MHRYNFTETLRRALTVAHQEATALGHASVSPEHLLLGLAGSEDPALLQIWSGLGIIPAEIRRTTLASFPIRQAERNVSGLSLTSGSRRALEFAMRETMVLKDDGVGPEHLLLGISRLGDEAAVRVLREAGATTDQVRAVLANLRGQPLPELAVLSIAITIELRGGGVIQQTFAGGDAEALEFVSGYLSI